MGPSGDKKPPFFRRHRRAVIALAAFMALAAGGWALAERYLLDMEQYRRLAIDTVTERTGIVTQIERMEVDLLPSPRVVVYGAVLDTPEAAATTKRVIARFDLARLLRREVRISSIEIEGLDLRVTDDPNGVPELVGRIERTWDETRTGGGGGGVDVALDRIWADDARVRFGSDEETFGTVDIAIDDVLSDRIAIGVTGKLDGTGDEAEIESNVVVIRDRVAKLWLLSGGIDLNEAELDRLPYENMPEGTVTASLRFTPGEGRVAATLRAAIASTDHPALSGDIEADAVWTGDAIQFKRALWDAAGARIEASGDFVDAADWRAGVTQARFTEGALDALLTMAERPRVRFEADSGGYIDAKEIQIGPGEDGKIRVASGSVEFTALAIVPTGEGAEERAARGIRGSMTVANNVITISEIRTDAARVSGTVSPDFDAATARVDLVGTANLGRLPWELFDALADFRRLDGELNVTRLAGTFPADGVLPGDFTLVAQLDAGAMVYADETVHIDLRDISGRITSDGGAIRTVVDGVTSDDARFDVAGAYEVAERVWTGTVRGDTESIAPPLFVDAVLREELRPVAVAIGESTLDVRISLLTEGRDTASIDIERPGDIPLTVQILFDDDGRLQTVTGRGTLPVDTMVRDYFPRLTGAGYAGFAIEYLPAGDRLSATLDLSQCSLDSDSVLRKQADTALVAKLDSVVAGTFDIRVFEVAIDGVPVITTTAEPQNGVIPLKADLALLAPLLVEGAHAGGTVFARYDANASATELKFDRVSISIDDKFAMDRIDGLLQIFPNSIATDGLEIHGARSDCVLRLAKVGGAWTGGLTGRSFNVHAITELIEAGLALAPEAVTDPARPASFWDEPWIGEFAVDLGTVHYNRGHIDDVKFRVLGEDRALRIRDIAVTPYAGTLTASVAIVPADDADARLKVTINATELDARTLNDLLWAEDRGFFGSLTGNVSFDAPLDDMKTMMAAGDGSVSIKGLSGSLGQTGFATKLLTALKTTDILNLRLHSLRDKGVTFETWDLELRMTDGVMAVHTFNLDGGGYAMIGTGWVNFANEETNAVVNVLPLESVSRMMRRVPILGGIAAAVSTDLMGVPVRFSGSPYDPQASVAGELAKNLLTTPLRAGEGALRSVGVGNSGGNNPPAEKKDAGNP